MHTTTRTPILSRIPPWKFLLALCAAGALGSAVLVGCGSDNDPELAAVTTTTTTEHDQLMRFVDDANGAADAGSEVASIRIDAIDYAFDGLPEEIPAGTKLTLHNASTVEMHELVAFRLPDDETRTAQELAALPESELERIFAGAPATVLLAEPGEDSFAAVGDGTFDEPGRYVVLCAIPQGADPHEFMTALEQSEGGPPEVDGGPPHFAIGMVADLVVG